MFDDARGAEQSSEGFRTLHALRIKGFAKVEVIAELADLPVDDAREHLVAFQQAELVSFREPRSLWQLTAAGREEHVRLLAGGPVVIGSAYATFLALNQDLKALCGRWQMGDGGVGDPDEAVVAELVALQGRAAPIVAEMAAVLPRLSPYGRRLAEACQRFANGETNMFTGVMCGSYHDVWMELHEDLILSQGIDRADEGAM